MRKKIYPISRIIASGLKLVNGGSGIQLTPFITCVDSLLIIGAILKRDKFEYSFFDARHLPICDELKCPRSIYNYARCILM